MAGLWPSRSSSFGPPFNRRWRRILTTYHQLSDSIVVGSEGRNYPAPQIAGWVRGKRDLHAASGLRPDATTQAAGQTAYCIWRGGIRPGFATEHPKSASRRNLPLARHLRRDCDAVSLAGGVRMADILCFPVVVVRSAERPNPSVRRRSQAASIPVSVWPRVDGIGRPDRRQTPPTLWPPLVVQCGQILALGVETESCRPHVGVIEVAADASRHQTTGHLSRACAPTVAARPPPNNRPIGPTLVYLPSMSLRGPATPFADTPPPDTDHVGTDADALPSRRLTLCCWRR